METANESARRARSGMVALPAVRRGRLDLHSRGVVCVPGLSGHIEAVTIMQWAAGMISFLAASAFYPWILGAATSPRWAVLALSLVWLRAACVPFVAYCFWMLDFDQAVHWGIGCAVLCWGWRADERTSQTVVLAFLAGVALSAFVALLQVNGWRGVPQVQEPGGLFLNKNVMGEAAVLGLAAAAVAFRQWTRFGQIVEVRYTWAALLSLPAAVAVLLSGSRTVWTASLLLVIIVLSQREAYRSLRMLIGMVVVGAVVMAAWHGATLPDTLLQRFMLWHGALRDLSLFGNGSYDFSTVQYREGYLHNDWLQFVYELGVVGLAPLAVVVLAGKDDAALPFMAALLIIGSFAFPLHMPATLWLCAFMLGYHLRRGIAAGRMVTLSGLAAPRLCDARRGARSVSVLALHRGGAGSVRIASRSGSRG
jgi:hypothetical protein